MKKSEKKVLTSPDCHGIIIVVGSPDWLSGNKKSKSLGYRQAVRHWILTPAFRRFESFYPSHVGAGFTAPIFSLKKSVACSSAPPLPQKCRHFWGPRPFGALQSSLLRPLPNSVFAVRRNFGPAFGQKELGEKPLLCGRFAFFSPKILAILGVLSLEHKNGLHSIQEVRFLAVYGFFCEVK